MIIDNFVFCIIILNYAKAAFSNQEQKNIKIQADGQSITNFANLLKTIVSVNEERVDAIRKIGNLQDYMLTRNRLPFGDYYDSVETPDTRKWQIQESEDFEEVKRRTNIPITNEESEKLYEKGQGHPTAELKELCSPQFVNKCTQFCKQKFKTACEAAGLCPKKTIKRIGRDCKL